MLLPITRVAWTAPAIASDVASLITVAVADAWSLVAPVECAGCAAPDRALCRECAAAIRPRLQHALLGLDDSRPPVPVVASLGYEGVVRDVVLAFKAEGRTELTRYLAPLVRCAVARAWPPGGADLIVPVPGSRTGTRQRGFSPPALLARRAGLVTVCALVAHDVGASQKHRRLAERLTDDRPRFSASARVRGARVLLFDDVVTSGATLRAAAQALHRAGAEVVAAAAVAATPRRHGASSIPWRFLADHDEGFSDKRGVKGYRVGKEA